MIKMISGTFGLLVDGIVVAKTKASEPFEASAEQEARLVKLGMAEYVNAQPTQVASVEEVAEAPEKSLEDMSAKELRVLGAEYGLEFPGNAKKVDMIAQIKEAIEDEDAPVFDAAEAVQ